MKIVEGVRLQHFATPGSMGVVTDTRYVRCFWAKLDEPTAIFAEGSSGIEVEGPPTPRNVVFPDGTEFLNGTRSDCFFLREKEVVSAPGQKVRHEEYVAEITADETSDLMRGRKTRAALAAGRDFCHINDNPLKEGARVKRLAAGRLVDKVR